MDGGYASALELLPGEIRSAASAAAARWATGAEEIRLRVGREPMVSLPEGENRLMRGRIVTQSDLREVLERATEASLHSASESIRGGYVTTRAGCRVGICGTAVAQAGEVGAIRSFSSLAIRIPRQCRGCADEVYESLFCAELPSVMLISPPGGGKTTLLRELVRRISDGGVRVSVADERGELAAVCDGAPRFDVGACTDVMTGGAKAQSAVMLLRSMTPQVLALDEITAPEDTAACEKAANCGVSLLCTAHAENPEQLRSRSVYRRIMEAGIFRYAVVISGRGSGRRCEVEQLG